MTPISLHMGWMDEGSTGYRDSEKVNAKTVAHCCLAHSYDVRGNIMYPHQSKISR